MVDLNKPVRTAGDLPARVLCTDYSGRPAFPVVAAVTSKTSGKEIILYYRTSGEHSSGSNSFNLVNIPETKTYFRAYRGGSKTSTLFYHSLVRCREVNPYSTILEFVEEDGELVRVVLHKV